MQIDTALRFSALTMVDDPHAFVDAVVLGGQRVDQLRDRTGKRLRDAYLVETLSSIAPWLPDVYRSTSGYIHFSGQEFFAAIQSLDDASRSFSVLISEDDQGFPEDSWLEMIECFDASVALLLAQFRAWRDIKAGSTGDA